VARHRSHRGNCNRRGALARPRRPAQNRRVVVGLFWDFFGAVLWGVGLLVQYMAGYRGTEQLMRREKAMPTIWVRRFPLWVAFRLGSDEVEYTQDNPIDSYSHIFWGLLLLALGFVLQVVGQIL
jgi:hypothetical protein